MYVMLCAQYVSVCNTAACDETLLEHADTWGDGWNGGYWEIEGTGLTGTLESGSSGSETVSLEEGFCGTINLVGGSWATEISMDFASTTLYAGDSVSFSITDCVPVVVENCGTHLTFVIVVIVVVLLLLLAYVDNIHR